jgi:hypothetical protein
MINRIFWDIDETLIHTCLQDPGQEHISFAIGEDLNVYYTIVRPCAKKLIEFSRQIVGADKVHILTTSTREYAQKINELAGWGFKNEDIFAREDLAIHCRSVKTAYGGSHEEYDPHIYAHKDNVLIDNLMPRYNGRKIGFIGIWKSLDNYFEVRDYYGVNFPDDPFEEEVVEFIKTRNKE